MPPAVDMPEMECRRQGNAGMAMGEHAAGAHVGPRGAMAPAAWTPGYAVLMFFMWWS